MICPKTEPAVTVARIGVDCFCIVTAVVVLKLTYTERSSQTEKLEAQCMAKTLIYLELVPMCVVCLMLTMKGFFSKGELQCNT